MVERYLYIHFKFSDYQAYTAMQGHKLPIFLIKGHAYLDL